MHVSPSAARRRRCCGYSAGAGASSSGHVEWRGRGSYGATLAGSPLTCSTAACSNTRCRLRSDGTHVRLSSMIGATTKSCAIMERIASLIPRLSRIRLDYCNRLRAYPRLFGDIVATNPRTDGEQHYILIAYSGRFYDCSRNRPRFAASWPAWIPSYGRAGWSIAP
jgi:hypothetical protein